MRPISKLLIVAAATSLLLSPTAFGAGFALFEQGAKAVAMGGAFAATADDPSAIFYNVAGIAQQRKTALNAGGTGIVFANEFRGDPNDPFTAGQTAEYRHHVFIPPNAYAIVPIGNNLTFGVGVTTPFGLRTNWEDPYVGRFISRDANIKLVDVEPAVAWRTSDDRFAFGFGADYRRSHIVLNRNLAPTGSGTNPFNGRIVDIANAFLNSDWNTAWGWNAGVLFKPTQMWRFGASYRSKMTIDYTGDATFTQIPTGNPQLDAIVRAGLPPNQGLTTSVNYPDLLVVGVATSMVPNWDIEFDINRWGWSTFKTLNINFSQTPANNIVRPQNWKDTFTYRLGANHPVTQHWDVRFGVLYDETPQPTEGVGPLLPDANRKGLSFGVGYKSGHWSLDATEFLLHFDKRSTLGQSSDNFNGRYQTDANLMSINLGYTF